MSATALATTRLPVVRESRPQLRLVHTGPRSLAELIDTTWAGLRAEAPVACPICDHRMEPRHGAGGVVGGRCTSCATELD